MATMLVVFHVIVAVLLIGVVLVQKGQGADMGASFGGGGSQTLFGSRGSGSFLGKMTGALAATFMVTSLSLAFFSQQHNESIVDTLVAPIQEEQQEAPATGDFDPSALRGNGGTDGLPAGQ